jgi:hypothetical protein
LSIAHVRVLIIYSLASRRLVRSSRLYVRPAFPLRRIGRPKSEFTVDLTSITKVLSLWEFTHTDISARSLSLLSNYRYTRAVSTLSIHPLAVAGSTSPPVRTQSRRTRESAPGCICTPLRSGSPSSHISPNPGSRRSSSSGGFPDSPRTPSPRERTCWRSWRPFARRGSRTTARGTSRVSARSVRRSSAPTGGNRGTQRLGADPPDEGRPLRTRDPRPAARRSERARTQAEVSLTAAHCSQRFHPFSVLESGSCSRGSRAPNMEHQ